MHILPGKQTWLGGPESLFLGGGGGGRDRCLLFSLNVGMKRKTERPLAEFKTNNLYYNSQQMKGVIAKTRLTSL